MNEYQKNIISNFKSDHPSCKNCKDSELWTMIVLGGYTKKSEKSKINMDEVYNRYTTKLNEITCEREKIVEFKKSYPDYSDLSDQDILEVINGL